MDSHSFRNNNLPDCGGCQHAATILHNKWTLIVSTKSTFNWYDLCMCSLIYSATSESTYVYIQFSNPIGIREAQSASQPHKSAYNIIIASSVVVKRSNDDDHVKIYAMENSLSLLRLQENYKATFAASVSSAACSLNRRGTFK